MRRIQMILAGVFLGGVILGQKKTDGLYEGEDPPAEPGVAGAVQPQDAPADDNGEGGTGGGDG